MERLPEEKQIFLLSALWIIFEIAGGACCVPGPAENECYAIATILQGNK